MAWFTDDDLYDLAGSRSYDRGTGYLPAVHDIRELPDGVAATVIGSSAYKVRLYDEAGSLSGRCDCPYGAEGNFCKHCVAVGLILLERETDATEADSDPVEDTEVIDFLNMMDHADLVHLIRRQALNNPALYRNLRLMAATAGDFPDFAFLRSQVDDLDPERIENADSYAEAACALIDAIADLIPNHAAPVQPLLRRALTCLGTAAERTAPDADPIREVAAAAWDDFLFACELAPADPHELGKWLAWFRLEGPECPEIRLAEYADLLGEAGLNEYWEALEAANELNPSEHRLRAAREEMIAATGNIDALVACHAEDLSGPHRYLGIAELLCDEGRTGEAIEWLERGRARAATESDPAWRDDDLAEALAELLERTGREAGAPDPREAP